MEYNKQQMGSLRNLANPNTPTQVDFDAEQAIGNAAVQKLAEWSVETTDVSAESRHSMFLDNFSDFPFTKSSVGAYYDTYREVFAGPKKDFDAYIVNGFKSELADLSSDTERQQWIMDNKEKIPEEYYADIGEVFTRYREKHGSQTVERSRLLNITDRRRHYSTLADRPLDHNKSNESHKRAAIKIDVHGLDPKIDDDGDFAFDGPQGLTKGFTLPDVEDPTTMYLAYNDIGPEVDKFIKSQRKESFDQEKSVDNQTCIALRRTLLEHPEEFRSNIIVDYALMSNPKDPSIAINGAIQEMMLDDVQQGRLTSPEEIIHRQIAYQNELIRGLRGRMI